MMFNAIVILIIIISFLLVLVILAQNPKGGISGQLMSGAASQMMGAQRSTDWIEKATWSLTAGLLGFCLIINVFIDRGSIENAKKSASIEAAKKIKLPTDAGTKLETPKGQPGEENKTTEGQIKTDAPKTEGGTSGN